MTAMAEGIAISRDGPRETMVRDLLDGDDTHDGSVCMPYMVCHLPSIYPRYVSINLPYGSVLGHGISWSGFLAVPRVAGGVQRDGRNMEISSKTSK